MKKSKKFLSALLMVCMIMAMSVPAFAADYPEYIPMEPTGTVTFDQIMAANATVTTRVGELEPAELLLPYNSGSGSSGASICFFTADARNFSFAMRLKPGSGGTGSNYHIQLWQINSNGSESKVGDAVQYHFNDGPYWKNKLTVGNKYYVKVSSTTVGTNGADGQYVWSTMVMAMSAPAVAADLPASDNQARVVDDDYLKHNEPFSGDYIKPVTVPADKPYVRVAIQNTATSGTLTARVYKIVDGKEVQFDTINAEPGKWGQTGVKELPDTEICVRMSLPEGYTPKGIINIRVSAQDFLRMDLE